MHAGRNWKAAAAHVGSRDARQFASHAQKYFIKLCMKGVLLPSKVAESGTGYTLSGKLLDPQSAAAKAYGFREGMLRGAHGPEDSPTCISLSAIMAAQDTHIIKHMSVQQYK